MAPSVEQELLSKVTDIHVHLFGVEGQPGALTKIADTLTDHDKRISRLERYALLVIGGSAVLMFLIEVWSKVK